MARTHLFSFMAKALASGGLRKRAAGSALTRRQMLRLSASAMGAATIGLGVGRPAFAQNTAPSIGIIGAGVAGLTAAYRLEKAGLAPVIYEASNRVGGRIFTRKDFYQGMFCELGGELVDSNHEDLKTLIADLGLELQPLDTGQGGEDLYFFGGAFHTAKQMLDPATQSGAFRVLAEQIVRDSEGLLDADKNWTDHARALDRISVKDYLKQFRGKTEGWAIDLIDVAYVGEFGLETADQSSLNLVDFISAELDKPFQIFGESDEAFRIKGGSSALIEALSSALKKASAARLGHALSRLDLKDGRVTATFDASSGKLAETYDFVILALPLTRLRQVQGLDELGLSAEKLMAIRELGYGTNAKLMTGTRSRAWRSASNRLPAPSNGSFYSDLVFQSVWETSRSQPGEAGVLTNFLGGKAGETDEAAAFAALRSGLGAMSPSIAESLDDKALTSFFWARHPFTLGSYACAKPGQYTTLLDVTAEPAVDGRLQFAGEHTSTDFLGYMNGGVQSGNRAATAVLEIARG